MTRSLVDLLNIWNRATAPYVPRTEHAHRRYATIARLADAELRRRFHVERDYTESDSGRRWPVIRHIGQNDLF